MRPLSDGVVDTCQALDIDEPIAVETADDEEGDRKRCAGRQNHVGFELAHGLPCDREVADEVDQAALSGPAGVDHVLMCEQALGVCCSERHPAMLEARPGALEGEHLQR